MVEDDERAAGAWAVRGGRDAANASGAGGVVADCEGGGGRLGGSDCHCGAGGFLRCGRFGGSELGWFVSLGSLKRWAGRLTMSVAVTETGTVVVTKVCTETAEWSN